MVKLLLLGKDPKTSELISIDQTDKGRFCNLVCPICAAPLVAKQGELNRWHFAHLPSTKCYGSVETYLHLHAKAILLRARKIVLPDGKHFYYDNVRLEAVIDSCRVDALLTKTRTGERVAVEIVVTNPLPQRKIDILNGFGYRVLEIDLSILDTIIDPLELVQIVLNQPENRILHSLPATPVESARYVPKIDWRFIVLGFAIIVGVTLLLLRPKRQFR
jgi:hypothetical protein